MNECIDYLNDPLKGIRRIVCAAINNQGTIVLGARHHDELMNNQIQGYLDEGGYWNKKDEIQGFIDQYGNFINRKDALIVAKAANQILKIGPGFNATKQLYSENLY